MVTILYFLASAQESKRCRSNSSQKFPDFNLLLLNYEGHSDLLLFLQNIGIYPNFIFNDSMDYNSCRVTRLKSDEIRTNPHCECTFSAENAFFTIVLVLSAGPNEFFTEPINNG